MVYSVVVVVTPRPGFCLRIGGASSPSVIISCSRNGVSRALRGSQHGAQCIAEADKPVLVPVAAVRCCSMDGSSCVSKVDNGQPWAYDKPMDIASGI